MIFNRSEKRKNGFEFGLRNLRSDDPAISFIKEIPFRDAIENSVPGGIVVDDDDGKRIYVNKSFYKMLGFVEDELSERHAPNFYLHDQDIDRLNEALRQTLNFNQPKEGFDLVFQHKTGRQIPVNLIISPFIQEDKRTLFLLNAIDISERKATEEAKSKLQSILLSSLESQKEIIIFSIDKEYNYLYFNKAHLDAMKFAYNNDIEVGMNILECISSEDDRKSLKENFDYALNGESHSYIQTYGDRNRAYYEIFFNPIINEKNQIIGCAGLARNITERVHAEQSLKNSEIKFKEIINQINDAIIVFDENEKIIIWNKGAEQLSGLKADEVINKNIIDIQYQLTPPAIRDRDLIEKIIKGITSMKTPDIFNKIIDSEAINFNTENLRQIQSMVFPIKLNGYHLFCSVVRDTTEIKRYEKEMLRISAEKDKFYSIIAQYLYTPFNVFNNFSKLMAEELDTLPIKEIQKMATMMSKSASNLYNLLDNLLQWTRMNQGKISFEPQELNFKKISQDAISILNPVTHSKNLVINYYIEDEIIVLADIFMLKTILRNIVACVLKFSNNEGQIDILAEQAPSRVLISVLGNNMKVDNNSLSKLFDNSQIHSTIGAAEEKGITLGLLLCKEFVEKHGGEIWVVNENGNGTEFKFTLPVISEKIKNIHK